MNVSKTSAWLRSAACVLAVGLGTTGCQREFSASHEVNIPFTEGDVADNMLVMAQALNMGNPANPSDIFDFACAGGFTVEEQNRLFSMLPVNEARRVPGEIARRGGMPDQPGLPLVFRSLGLSDYTGPAVITTAGEFRLVDRVTNGFAKIVGSIMFCSGMPLMSPAVGCTTIGGLDSMVVVPQADTQLEGLNWAHEYGHAVGIAGDINDVRRVMHFANVSTATAVTNEECTFFTLPIDSDGPGGRRPQLSVASAEPQTAGSRPVQSLPVTQRYGLSVEEFARLSFHHGLGYAIVDELAASDVAPLLRMLADPAEASHRANVLALLGLVGDESVGAVIEAHVDALRRQPIDGANMGELMSALSGLGALANRLQSAPALAALERWADATSWNVPDAKLAQSVRIMLMRTLAMTGMPGAQHVMEGMATSASDARTRATMAELLQAAQTVRTRGLRAYMTGS